MVTVVGRRNKHCLCETCEKNGRGGYAPVASDNEETSASDSDVDTTDITPTVPVNLNINERRTRSRVYAVVAAAEQDSDDSEDEKDIADPLASTGAVAPSEGIEFEGGSSRASSMQRLETQSRSALRLTDTATPDPSSARPPSVSSSLSTATSEQRKTPFRSIISTRRQKLEASATPEADRKTSTPGLSESASCPPAIRRSVRSVSRLSTVLVDKGKGKERASDEPETRTLRGRPPVPEKVSVPAPPPKPEVPRGKDGKPLPTCITCSNVLPVISVDSEVVWGLTFGNEAPHKRGRKKKLKQECPRYVFV
ncbi:hypothetical protein CONPUDRAFT_163798 [Coniophora puteana RWD-64-598 SS2]|uniref:Uncharacterized protein n=1 Tax=Coniophora puteana (strain RWD-64-598) TaxID=741705 RepID=A0A5M3MUB7_CONPW|nr:uncharacterized protein CONPUDRAFT_163798 [Coniophora puteana RWD-64-598 SS2]EIW82719.1 hypothetical protein CONPUDRAFT_163798 [Coniophora puteana RWD-64-598 SS2]